MYFEEHNGKSYLIYDGIGTINSLTGYEYGRDIYVNVIAREIRVNEIINELSLYISPMPSVHINGLSRYKLVLGSSNEYVSTKLFITNAKVEKANNSNGFYNRIEFTDCEIVSLSSAIKYIKMVNSTCDSKIEIERATAIECIDSDLSYPKKIQADLLILKGTTKVHLQSGKINYVQMHNISRFINVSVFKAEVEKLSIINCKENIVDIQFITKNNTVLLNVENSSINKLNVNPVKHNINLEITNSTIDNLYMTNNVSYIQSDNSVKNMEFIDNNEMPPEVKQSRLKFNQLINKQSFTNEDASDIISLFKTSESLFANTHGIKLLINNNINYNEKDKMDAIIELIESFPSLIKSHFEELYNVLNKVAPGRNALFRLLENNLIPIGNYDFLYSMSSEAQTDIFNELISTHTSLPVIDINSIYFKLLGMVKNIVRMPTNSEYIGTIDKDNYDIIKRISIYKPVIAYHIFKTLGTGKYSIKNQLNDFNLTTILDITFNNLPDKDLFDLLMTKYKIPYLINECLGNYGKALANIITSAIRFNTKVDAIINELYLVNNIRPVTIILNTPLLRRFVGENNKLDPRLFIIRICGGTEYDFINRIYPEEYQQRLVSEILTDDSSFDNREELIEPFINAVYTNTEIIQSMKTEMATLYKRYIPEGTVPLNTTNVVITRMLEAEIKKIKKSIPFKKTLRAQKTVYIDTVFEEKGTYNKGTKEYNTCLVIERYMNENKINSMNSEELSDLEINKVSPIEHSEMKETLIHSSTIMFIIQINNKLSLMTKSNFSEDKINKYNNYKGMPRKQSVITVDLLEVEYLESTFESVAIITELMLYPDRIPSSQSIKSSISRITIKFNNIPSTRFYSDIEYLKNYMEKNNTDMLNINELAKIDKQLLKTESDVNEESAYEEQYKILTNPRNWVLKENRIYLEAQSLSPNQQILLMNLKSVTMLTELNSKFGVSKQDMADKINSYIKHSNHPVSRVFLTIVWVRFDIDEDNKSIWINEIQTDMTKICKWTKTESNIMDKLNDKLSLNALTVFKQYVRTHFDGYTVCIPSTKTRKSMLGGSPMIATYDNNPKKLKFKLALLSDTSWANHGNGSYQVYIWNSVNEKKKPI